jgi:hypothetical protein
MHPAPASNVFRVSKGMKVFLTCVLGPLAGLCFVGPFLLLSDRYLAAGAWAFLLGVGFVLGAVFSALLLAAYQSRVEILSGSVRKVEIFRRVRELRFEEIEGFRIFEGQHIPTVALVPKDKARKPLKIELALERRQELLQWIQTSFPNLDVAELQTEMQGILADEQLGFSEEQRVASLTRVRNYAKALNGVTMAAVLWGMFYPQPYAVAMTALAVLPVLAVLLLKLFPRLVQFDTKRHSAHPSVAYAVFGPACVLMLRGFLDWHILEWGGFWLPFVAIGVALTATVFACAADARKQAGLITVPLFAFAYSFGLVTHLNCYYDRSRPVVYRTVVESRRISSGKHTSYYLTLRPWLGQPIAEEVSVGSATYDRHAAGSLAVVIVREGTLAVKWYVVR